MGYDVYFERDAARSHISRAEWLHALEHTPGVRRARDATADPHGWVGYRVNPHRGPSQFHLNADRAYDAEVFFAEEEMWRRAIYWHSMFGRPGSADGVVTFAAPPHGVDEASYPVSVAARALAERLRAELVGEDETAYET